MTGETDTLHQMLQELGQRVAALDRGLAHLTERVDEGKLSDMALRQLLQNTVPKVQNIERMMTELVARLPCQIKAPPKGES